MAIRKITVDGQPAVQVDTEEDFASALDSGLLIVADDEIGEPFGFPPYEDDLATLEDTEPPPDDWA